jgi:hypothetical protein
MRLHTRGSGFVTSFALASCLLACGGTSPANDAGGSNDVGGTVDAPHTTTENVVVRVIDDAGPVVGATVLIDDAAGAHHEGSTGTDGTAMLQAVWGTGRVSITAVATGHVLATLHAFARSELGARADATGTITIQTSVNPTLVTFSGTITNAMSPSTNYIDLIPNIPGKLTVTGTTFTGTIATRRAFEIFAFESRYDSTGSFEYTYVPLSARRIPHAAVTTSGTMIVDLSPSLPLTTVSGSLLVPPDGHRVQAGLPNIIVTSDESAAYDSFGFASSMNISTDGLSFDFTVSQLATIDATTPITDYYFQLDTGMYTEIRVDGVPTAHPITSASQWVAPPRVLSPASGVTAPLHDPIQLGDIDPSAPVQIRLFGDTGLLWLLELPTGGSRVVFPAIPDGVDTSSWTNLAITAVACEPWPDHVATCRRSAGGDNGFISL